VKRIETLPAKECACERFFVNSVIWSEVSGTKCRTLWLSICWWSKQESYGPTLRRWKSAPRFSGKCNQTQDQTKRLLNDTISGKVVSIRNFVSRGAADKRWLVLSVFEHK
jgi:hypothetical protein